MWFRNRVTMRGTPRKCWARVAASRSASAHRCSLGVGYRIDCTAGAGAGCWSVQGAQNQANQASSPANLKRALISNLRNYSTQFRKMMFSWGRNRVEGSKKRGESSSVVSASWADTKAERLEPRVLRWCKRAKKAKKGQKKVSHRISKMK